MYEKIWGLKQLENLALPYPPYEVIDIDRDKPADIEEYVIKKIRHVSIPYMKNDRIGVTIRVSMPGTLDKLAKHGGLHVTEEKEILKRVLEKYRQYKPGGKIVVQHTVDARCSGTILKENDRAIIEAIFGDAPPLLEGEAADYERWIFLSKLGRWKKERVYIQDDKERAVLTPKDIQTFEGYIRRLPSNVYMEWSISRSGKLYFYEYSKLSSRRS